MTENNGRTTLRKWLSEHAKEEPVHYRNIADALDRTPESVSASLSIEKKQAEQDERPPYFVRVAPGLYRYNEVCEGAIDEDKISEVRERAKQFNLRAREQLSYAIAELDLDAFENLTKVLLTNIRAHTEPKSDGGYLEVHERRNGSTVIMTSAWWDDGGKAPVVYYAKKCDLDEEIGKETILEIRGDLPTYGANQGVLLSNGICNDEARRVAVQENRSVPPIHIMDKDIILSILFESRTGIREVPVNVYLIDREFFDNISS
ncbi:hypothetical protein EU537_04100 [Candidatus Thorarchaeota archaeon]|nr:MAG: hypothetical protein EU537_04100 [Candidatus Thorarchaeota archaeon]